MNAAKTDTERTEAAALIIKYELMISGLLQREHPFVLVVLLIHWIVGELHKLHKA